MFDFNDIINALIASDQARVLELVKDGLSRGADAREILEKGLIAGMDRVGERMENEDMFIPEVLMAAKAMSAAVEILKPHLGKEGVVSKGKVVIGTVSGDIHDIGKNLVAMLLSSAGFDVYNLGADIDPKRFVDAVKAQRADILGLSALLTTTMPMMKETITAVERAGIRNQVKIMIGGAPVTQSFADEIGADGYASDASSATKLAKSLLE
jgi:5-methyltetrahydrofolate--homocysteine methyltransferase